MTVARWMLVVLAACAGSPPNDTAACTLAARTTCDECVDGPQECWFEGTTFAAESCQGCQARVGLLDALCDAGETATEEELEAGIFCSPITCVSGQCGCEFHCWEDEAWATISCATCATSPVEPTGECGWDPSTEACAYLP